MALGFDGGTVRHVVMLLDVWLWCMGIPFAIGICCMEGHCARSCSLCMSAASHEKSF